MDSNNQLKQRIEEAFGEKCFFGNSLLGHRRETLTVEFRIEKALLVISYYSDANPPFFGVYSSGIYFSLYPNSPPTFDVFPQSNSDVPRDWVKVLWHGLKKLNFTDYLFYLEQAFSITNHEKLEWYLYDS